ncbi:MAG: DUF3592 domain-containing protein [Pseudomonadota bacterium]
MRARMIGRRNGPFVRVLLFLIPLGFLVAGGYLLLDAYRFSQTAVRVQGEVIALEEATRRQTSNGESFRRTTTTYRPTIRFTDRSGREREATTHMSSSNYDYPIGTRLDVLYDPAAPDELRVDGPMSLWGLPAILLGGGLLALLVMGYGTRKRRPDYADGPIETLR